jgi:vacuolar-type H+-ATPase subunit H
MEGLVDEKVLEELKFHQETIEADAHSPLHLIREKEMEISGRVLAAKREAEEIVAAARKKAVDVVAKAEEQSEALGREREQKVLEEVDREITQVKADAETEAKDLERLLANRIDGAADFIVGTVLSV